MAASKPTSWLSTAPRPPCPLSLDFGTLAGGLGCFPLDHGTSLPQSHSLGHPTAFVVWFGSVSGKPPCRSVTLPPRCCQPGAAPKCISGRTSYLRVRLAFHPYPQVIPAVCNRHGFGPPRACSARFTLPMGRSPGFGSARRNLSPFRTRFPSGSGCRCLNLATPNHSSAHSTKGTPSPRLASGSDRLEAHGFRIYFTPLAGVLFTIPSRYWFTIGRWSYLALGGGPPCFPPDFACRAVLTIQLHTGSHTLSPTGLSPSPVTRSSGVRLTVDPSASGLLPRSQQIVQPHDRQRQQAPTPIMVWALPRSLAATEGILSFPQGTEMFQFPRFPSCQRRMTGYHPRRVAPFGYPWIASCQRFPRAFRRVATSFIGNQRQGIHRVPIIPACSSPSTPCLVPSRDATRSDRLRRPPSCLHWSDRTAVLSCQIPAR